MKRLAILVALVVIAGIAGIVRSHSRNGFAEGLVSHNSEAQTRDEIRRTFELAPGASVEIAGINGSVKIETSDTKTADVFIERTGAGQEALNRRKIVVEADANSLRIIGEKCNVGFFERLFGSNPTERVTLKLPKQIALRTKGVNGSVTVGDLDGSVDVRGINGRVQIASASGTADFKGVNGNIVVGIKQLERDGVSISGVNGNIELQLAENVNADFDAHGMNGRVVSELPGVMVDKERGGSYSARIGSGGSAISAKGINGNIRLTRGVLASSIKSETNDSKVENGN